VALLTLAKDCKVIDATGRVVMPAFVDLETSMVHAHPTPRNFERLLRHYGSADREVFRDVLDEAGRSLSGLSTQSLRRRAETIARGMIRYGTATVESRAGYSLDETA
jgi:imidazolonepropionase-like amidohydrolase